MAKEIEWTPESISGFETIIEYLFNHWTEKEAEHFVVSTEIVINFISENPKMFRKTGKKNVHEALITPHNLMIYKVYSNRIVILRFWDTRKNPRKKKHK